MTLDYLNVTIDVWDREEFQLSYPVMGNTKEEPEWFQWQAQSGKLIIEEKAYLDVVVDDGDLDIS